MTDSERCLFDAIIERLEQGGQVGAVSILKHWITHEIAQK